MVATRTFRTSGKTLSAVAKSRVGSHQSEELFQAQRWQQNFPERQKYFLTSDAMSDAISTAKQFLTQRRPYPLREKILCNVPLLSE
jgi:hypothetical protein